MKRHLLAAATVLALLLSGCVTQQVTSIPLTSEQVAPKPISANVEVYRDTSPERPYKRIARLNVHIEKTVLLSSSLDAAIGQLVDKARSVGADALIEISDDRSHLNETRILNVTATAIVYTD